MSLTTECGKTQQGRWALHAATDAVAELRASPDADDEALREIILAHTYEAVLRCAAEMETDAAKKREATDRWTQMRGVLALRRLHKAKGATP